MPRLSVCSSGIARVRTRRRAAEGDQKARHKMAVAQFRDEEIKHGVRPVQKSKVIIFFIMAMPIAIQHMAMQETILPCVVVHRRLT